MFLASDGYDSSSKLGDSEFKRALLGSGVRLFALITGEDSASRSRTPEIPGGAEWVRGLAAATGGDTTIFQVGADSISTFSPRFHTPIQLSTRGQQVMSFATKGFDEEITDFYRLTIKLTEPLEKPRDLQLEVVDRNGKKNSHWLVVYPHRLAACP